MIHNIRCNKLTTPITGVNAGFFTPNFNYVTCGQLYACTLAEFLKQNVKINFHVIEKLKIQNFSYYLNRKRIHIQTLIN